MPSARSAHAKCLHVPLDTCGALLAFADEAEIADCLVRDRGLVVVVRNLTSTRIPMRAQVPRIAERDNFKPLLVDCFHLIDRLRATITEQGTAARLGDSF